MRSSFVLILLVAGCANEAPIPDASVPAVEARVQVFPAAASVLLGQSQQLAALVTGLEDPAVIWSVDEGDGRVDSNGRFDSGARPGTTVVRATSVRRPELSGTARLTVLEPPAPARIRITLTPTQARLSVGERLQLLAMVTGATDSAVSFSATAGVISATGEFTAPLEPGFVTVRATSVQDPSVSATSTLVVTDQVSITVAPHMVAMTLGEQASFAATVVGAPTNRVAWSATGGTVSDAGVYAPATEGDFLVTATSVADPSRSASAMVNVSPIRLQLQPTTVTLDANGSQQFFAQVLGSTNGAVSWTASGGTIDPNGLYLAGALPGTFFVRATSVANPTRFAQAAVTIRDVTVQVTPATSTLRIGTTRQFQALVQGSANQAVTWSIETPGGGSISSTGLYTAPMAAGQFTIKASSLVSPTAFATASIAVQTAPVISVSITSPTTTQTVPQGGTLLFTAQVSGTSSTSVTWTTSGGTIASNGTFTAPIGSSAAGTYTITATSQADPTQNATATVIVPPVQVLVSPMSSTVVAANTTNATPTSQVFGAMVTGATDSRVTWSVRESNGGSIGSGGTYQSPSVAGTYTVVATSTADPTKQGTAAVTVLQVPVVVTVSPRNPTVAPGSISAFSASVANAITPGVTWSIADGGAGGRIDAQGNYSAPATFGRDTVVATSRQDATRSDQTVVTVCNAGGVCVPSNPCRIGNVSCAGAMGPVCLETGSSSPNGTPCGTNQVCNGGSCVSCTPGGACTTADPCSLGTISCVTGSARCVSGPPNPAKPDGSTCSPTVNGLCQQGRCQCSGNATFAFGDCQVCPAFTDTTVRVNADPRIGADNACCGRTAVTGLGGPCLTITQAVQNLGGSGWSVNVTGDLTSTVSLQEDYPIELSRGVLVTLGSNFVPGRQGVPVFAVARDSSSVVIGGGKLGVTSAGLSTGASAGVIVHARDAGVSPQVFLSGTEITATTDGVVIESGGTASFSGVVLNRITNAGLLCRSTLDSSRAATISSGTLSVTRARYGAFLGTGCSARISNGTFGPPVSSTTSTIVCPLPRPLEYGLWLEGNAVANDLFGSVACANTDGIALKANPLLTTNDPRAANARFVLRRNGCAGVSAEVGRISLVSSTIRQNHFGVWVTSPLGSPDPLQAPVSLTLTPFTSRNEVLCNRAQPDGACSTGAFASRGFNVFNNSGFVIDASSVNWGELPLGRCDCDSTLTSCACAGTAFGLLSPPDGLPILNAPLVAGAQGTPSVITSNFALSSTPVCP
jgi:hypothetical protein